MILQKIKTSPVYALITSFLLFALPALTYAQQPNPNSGCSPVYVPGTGLSGILDLIGCLLRSVIPILVTIAVIVFVYGIVKYIRNADNSEQREEGRQFMLYGIIALFVMVSIWGLVGVLGATLGVDAVLPTLPQTQQ